MPMLLQRLTAQALQSGCMGWNPLNFIVCLRNIVNCSGFKNQREPQSVYQER